MTDTLAMLKTRRSVPPQFLAAPGPDGAQLHDLLTIAARVPDHGKLAPWRFILFEGAGKERACEIVARVFKARNPEADDARVGLERARLAPAPLVIAVVSRARPHPKIPLWEQELSAGAVCMNLVVAANAMGFGCSWLTNWFSFDAEVMAAFGLTQDERMAGMIHIGTPTFAPTDRDRPDLATLVTRFGG